MKTDASHTPASDPGRGAVRALLACVVVLAGCGRQQQTELPMPENPKQAATQVEQVFDQAPPEVKEAATTASVAMREGDYERAVASLQAVRSREGLTLQQGMAVYQSMVALEAELVGAMQAGDPRAKQAYEMLKRMKRDR